MRLRHIAKTALASFNRRLYPDSPRPDPEHPLASTLPRGFLLGTATAAHQIEGGLDNDWTDWERGHHAGGAPHVKGRTASGDACGSWRLFDQDLECMRRLGANAYRMSVEWSRLEPAEGAWDEQAADQYLAWMKKLRAASITPMVTLHHFTLPRWVATQGGFLNDRTIELAAAFAGRVAKKLGGEVDLWCTINEPNVLATMSYLKGVFPPGLKDARLTAQVLARLLKAHARMAEAIRENDTTDADGDGHATRIGVAHHVRIFKPAGSAPLDRLLTGFTDQFWNQSIIDAYTEGRIRLFVPGLVDIDEAVPGLAGSYDYLGINYYGRDHIAADLRDPSLSRQFVPDDLPKTDLGWEIYPDGLFQVLMRYGGLGLPIYVTENGIADRSGLIRPDYLRSHIGALARAARGGADVRGYFHWSLMDNFEWAEGFEPRFGLFRVDFNSPEKTRRPTPAVEAFRAIAAQIGIPAAEARLNSATETA